MEETLQLLTRVNLVCLRGQVMGGALARVMGGVTGAAQLSGGEPEDSVTVVGGASGLQGGAFQAGHHLPRLGQQTLEPIGGAVPAILTGTGRRTSHTQHTGPCNHGNLHTANLT